jgi:pSer/pThr/pTyr-binding forkhead associated (FHA) protein
MAYLIVEKGEDKDIGMKFNLGEKPLIIGRKTAQNVPDIALNSEFISRRHAEIGFANGSFYVQDLGSTNGTAVDQKQIDAGQPELLLHDVVIGLGLQSGTARVLLRFKETPTVRTTRIVPKSDMVTKDRLAIDRKTKEVWIDGKMIGLTPKEYGLLVYLDSHRNMMCGRDEIIANVWPEVLDPGGVADAAIDQLVRRLRVKIEKDSNHPTILINKKGFGYRLA